ncbi:hypothetical protein N7476_000346 [Penicillium atrosanguineum]|uniref:BCS1 N-terminal domain-containing protein n=1 Tax=Penicillium atrosanguineum TaxID=1132637 RepID=A0A9W9QEB5_9EURO|nr:hypothetical protein N7476_000346 [Penicillium atrosanguineum]
MSEPPDEALNSLLDTFAPGLSWLVRLISAALGVNVLSSVLPLVALPIISTFLLPSLSRALEPIISFFVASAEIKHRNNLYPQVTRWMSEVESYSCSGSAIAGITEAFGYLWDSNDKSPEYVDTEIPAHQGKIERIRITPGQGHYHFFQYQDCLFAFYRDPHRNVLDHFSRNGENLYFYYMFWNRAVFENLLEDIQKVNVDLRRGKLPVYSAYQVKGDASWRKMSDEIPRSPDSLALDEGLKKEMFEDIENFLSKAVVQLYQKRGIPYRRGYLLYGPPGTGKTSWCRVIATSFGFALYVIDPATVDDHGLRELFRTLPERCLVVLEDIDCAGIDQRGNTTNEKKMGPVKKG